MGKNDSIPDINWLAQPEPHNYPAALSYLSLIFEPVLAAQRVQQLRDAPLEGFKAKDVFRASGLSLLGVSNSHVEKNIEKIEDGKARFEGVVGTGVAWDEAAVSRFAA